jgi:hypothetical protein
MNDLAEKALRGLELTRREIVARPVAALSVAGFVAAAAVVVSGGRIGAAPAVVPPNRWLGLLPPASYRTTGVGLGVVMLAAVLGLLALWVVTLHVARVRGFAPRQIWPIAGAWAVPFAVGPPLLDTDGYGYVAHGLLARLSLSPYHHGPIDLGRSRLVLAIDPTWRSARSSDGPLAGFAEHLTASVSGGHVVPALLIIRAVGVLSVVSLGRNAARLAGPRASDALGLIVLNPAVLALVVSAGNIAGPVAALLLAAVAAARGRRWRRAVVWVCVAAGLKPVALLALPPVIALHLLGARGRKRRRRAGHDALLVAVLLSALTLLVPYGLGWLANLRIATHDHVPVAPSSLISDVVGWIVPFASFDDLEVGGRFAAGAAALTAVGYLYATTRARPLGETIGFTLLAVAILAPVVYPPFLLWGLLCLVPTARGLYRDWVLALSAAACVMSPGGLGERGGLYATIGVLVALGAALLAREVRRQRAARAAAADVVRRPEPTVRPAADVAERLSGPPARARS